MPGFDLLPACCVQFVGPEYAYSGGQFLTIMHMPKRPLLERHIVASLNVFHPVSFSLLSVSSQALITQLDVGKGQV